jgi:DNA-binding MarR family transcriptional regulator
MVQASRTFAAAVIRSLSSVSHTVSVPQLRVLVMLSEVGRANLGAVARELGVNASNASRTCDRLVRNELLERRTDPHDRRQVSLALSRSGRRLVAQVMAHRRDLLAEVVGEMSQRDQERFMRALGAFNAAATRLAATNESGTANGVSSSPWSA